MLVKCDPRFGRWDSHRYRLQEINFRISLSVVESVPAKISLFFFFAVAAFSPDNIPMVFSLTPKALGHTTYFDHSGHDQIELPRDGPTIKES